MHTTAAEPAATAATLDESSGADDLSEVEGYLHHLLPALTHAVGAARAAATDGAAAPEEEQPTSSSSLEQLGLSRGALAAAGLPPHAISGLHRALKAHAGAFRTLVADEVQQLRGLLMQQQGASSSHQLSGTIQLLDGPVIAAGGRAAGKAPSSARNQQLLSAASQPTATPSAPERDGIADIDTAGSDTGGAAAAAAAAAPCRPAGQVLTTNSKDAQAHAHAGPSASELAHDYAQAYASMKESLEIRLRHEQRCREFLQVRRCCRVRRAVSKGLSEHRKWTLMPFFVAGVWRHPCVREGMSAFLPTPVCCPTMLACDGHTVCMQGKVQQLEAAVNDSAAQLDAASRRSDEQRSEMCKLATEHAELQQALATSHAAHLALQQHHTGQMEAWKVERELMEQQHKQQLEALHQVRLDWLWRLTRTRAGGLLQWN